MISRIASDQHIIQTFAKMFGNRLDFGKTALIYILISIDLTLSESIIL